jgi:tetratricopeptide (TPR) repeat protein
MNRIARVPVLAAAALSLMLLSAGCKRLEARDQLNKGVQAYKAARYEEAIGHFQRAVNLDPTYPMTRIYLATAYMQQVVPDLTTPENLKNAQLAIDSYQKVLDEHPNDINSLKGIASLYLSMDKFDEAKNWQIKVLAVDPKDAEAAYTIGVVDWRVAYKNAIAALKGAGLQDDGSGNPKAPKSVCAEIQKENSAVVAEGLKYLNQAVEVRPTYDDAMSYLNLMYRRQADLECGNDAARKDDVAKAVEWREKAMGTRKTNEEKKAAAASGGIVMDQNK